MSGINIFWRLDLVTSDQNTSKIVGFGKLPVGWHFGEGQPATPSEVHSALTLHSLMIQQGARSTEAFPGIDGSILISGFFGEEVLDVLCRSDGKFNILHERGTLDVCDEQGLPFDFARDYIKALQWKKSFAFFTPATTVQSANASQVSPSALRQMVARPYSIARVRKLRPARFVTTLTASTGQSVGTLRYSAGSKLVSYLNNPG